MEGFCSILSRFGERIHIVPHKLMEAFRSIVCRFGEKVAIIPFEVDGGIGFDGGVLIDSLQ